MSCEFELSTILVISLNMNLFTILFESLTVLFYQIGNQSRMRFRIFNDLEKRREMEFTEKDFLW